MDAIFYGGKAEGRVAPPPSKSHTHRAIILAALSGGKCRIDSPLISFDTKATMDAVRSMGASVTECENHLIVDCPELHAPDREIDVLNSGTTMRLMTGICSLFDSETLLTGDESIRKRPMGPLLDSLSGCGAKCVSDGGKAPLSVRGPLTGNTLSIDGSVSSQFVSSLIMTSAMTGRPMDVNITGKLVSKPYIDITLSIMRKFGAKAEFSGSTCHVEPTGYSPADYRVPADFSSAAFPLVAGGIGGKITAEGLDLSDAQGDSRIIDVLREAGCEITENKDGVTCARTGNLRAAEIDVGDIPDLFPIIAVLLSTAKGKSRLYGAPHLRFKESDRIDLTEKMLNNLGGHIKGTDDGCIIEGVPGLHAGHIEHRGDHRIFMAGAIASLVSDGPVSMENDGCWNVSYPGFPEQMKAVGMKMNFRGKIPRKRFSFRAVLRLPPRSLHEERFPILRTLFP